MVGRNQLTRRLTRTPKKTVPVISGVSPLAFFCVLARDRFYSSFLKKGGWKPTRACHQYLIDMGVKISRKELLKILHSKAECGGFVTVGGIRQKQWII